MAKTVSLTLPLTRADLADLQVGDEVLLSGPRLHHARRRPRARPAMLGRHGHLPSIWKVPPSSTPAPPPRRPGAPWARSAPPPPAAWISPRRRSSRPASSPPSARASAAPKSCAPARKPAASTSAPWAASPHCWRKSVTESELVGWEDLGTEALRKLTLKDFPVYVAVDTKGGDLYRKIEAAAQ